MVLCDVSQNYNNALIVFVYRMTQKDYFKAHEYLQRSQYEYETWYGRNHHVVSDVLHEFGRLLSNPNNTYRQDEERAESLYRRALKLRSHAYGASSVKAAETMFALGEEVLANCGASSEN